MKMPRRSSRQLQLTLSVRCAPRLPEEQEREVVAALAELLLAAVEERHGDEGRDEDECKDHD
jgi:hypothetical protein